MTVVTIVPATVEHLPWLRVLFDRFVAELPVAYPTMDAAESDRFVQSVYAHLTQNPAFACFVALAADEVVGFVGGEITDRFIGRPHRVGNAHWLYVAPSYRAQGVGRALIAAGVAWMTQHEVNDRVSGSRATVLSGGLAAPGGIDQPAPGTHTYTVTVEVIGAGGSLTFATSSDPTKTGSYSAVELS